ncbi:hypothetical protein BJ878DRAFT_502041 [Calycina marina]|uniref:Secreted protein n=1 Tax=Calycina marina TaxID=1763456 RepID=A0A9P7Z5N1_9HELO|nr:hypothetical protein BJ878DRAFT_502041 [Calycina marina]
MLFCDRLILLLTLPTYRARSTLSYTQSVDVPPYAKFTTHKRTRRGAHAADVRPSTSKKNVAATPNAGEEHECLPVE